jgi:hypothetical protein
MHMTKSLKYRNFHIMFSHNQKKHVLACIFGFNKSLLKLWELGQYFKNTKKIFCLLLISKIMNLYIRCIPDIKR